MALYAVERGRPPGNMPRGIVTLNEDSSQAHGLVFWAPGAGTHAPYRSLASRPLIGTPQGGIGALYKSGLCLSHDYDGTNDRTDFSNLYDPSAGFTMTAWIHPDVIVRATSLFVWLAHIAGDAAQGPVVFILGDGSTSGALGCNITRATSPIQRVTAASFLEAGRWQHVAVAYNGGTAATDISIFRDATVAGSYSVSSNGSGAISAAAGSYSVGGRIFDDARNFDGGIADVRVYNKVIGATGLAPMVHPASRWELFSQPSTRVYFDFTPATGNRRRRVLLSAA